MKHIKYEFGSNATEGLGTVFSETKPEYAARRIKAAMAGFGTDEAAICRMLAGGVDARECGKIAQKFQEMYDVSLEDMLALELGGMFEGDFKMACAMLVNWPPSNEPTKGKEAEINADFGTTDITEGCDRDELTRRLDMLVEANEALKDNIAETDAVEIYKACHGGWTGLGTDEESLVGVICNRTKGQLERIDQAYRRLYEKTLQDEIRSETSGDFMDMLLLCQMEEAEGDAYLLKKATDGWGTDEQAVIDVLAPKSPERLRAVRDLYEARYEKSLMDLLDEETSGLFEGDFNQTIKAMLVRAETVDMDQEVDEEAAAEQATQLYNAMKSMFGTDEKTVVELLCSQAPQQIQAIRVSFENQYGASLASWIESDFSGDADDALIALTLEPMDYYVRVLRKAMVGFGTDEAAITRILGSLNKAEIGQVVERYAANYDRELVADLKSEVGGDYGMAVLTWVAGGEPSQGMEAVVEGGEDEVEEEEEAEEETAVEEEPDSEEQEEPEAVNDADEEEAKFALERKKKAQAKRRKKRKAANARKKAAAQKAKQSTRRSRKRPWRGLLSAAARSSQPWRPLKKNSVPY